MSSSWGLPLAQLEYRLLPALCAGLGPPAPQELTEQTLIGLPGCIGMPCMLSSIPDIPLPPAGSIPPPAPPPP